MEYASVYYVSDEIWATMTNVMHTTRMIALLLLPTFIGIHFCVQYVREGLYGENSKAAIISSLSKGVFLTLFLSFFEEIMSMLDQLTCVLMKELGIEASMNEYLVSLQEHLSEEKTDDVSFLDFSRYVIGSMVNKIKNFVLGALQMFSRGVIHSVRGYLLVFSTQVGPLAIVASALPGRYAKIASNWFSLQVSFFMWGLTMALIDLTLVQLKIKTIAGCSLLALIGSFALFTMYLIVGTITSLYVGNMVGGSLFTTVTGFATTQIISGAKFLYNFRRKKKESE